jgi:hypothetical protein
MAKMTAARDDADLDNGRRDDLDDAAGQHSGIYKNK